MVRIVLKSLHLVDRKNVSVSSFTSRTILAIFPILSTMPNTFSILECYLIEWECVKIEPGPELYVFIGLQLRKFICDNFVKEDIH